MYNEIFDLTGKKAIVTGGAGDLGTSMVEGLIESGTDLVIIDIDDRAEQMVADFCAKGHNAYFVKANLMDRIDLEAAFNKAVEILGGKVDIMLNAAGIQRRHKSELFPYDDWDAVIEINLTATFRFCQLAAINMMENGGGKIINIASMLSFFGGFTVPAYAASKGGVAQITKAMANEWASQGININAIAPGYMDTQMNINIVNDPVRNDEILKRIPQGRWGTGEDVKGVVVFLASKASDYLNGAVIPVDGGYLGR